MSFKRIRNIILILLNFFIIVFQLSAYDYGNSDLRLGVVIQPKFILSVPFNDSLNNELKFSNRRLRLLASGLIDEKIHYFLQLGFSPDDFNSVKSIEGSSQIPVFDAYIDYYFDKKTYIRLGQFKLPGNLSRLMSFKNLSFTERSNAEGLLKIYRDIGLLAYKSFNFNEIILNGYFSITHGEGVNSKTSNNSGFNYTVRTEILPFGQFSKNNILCEMDKDGEQDLKLMIGGAYNLNVHSNRQFSVTGNKLLASKNINSYFFDLLLKYKGLSFFAEYLGRVVDNNLQKNADSLAFEGEGYSVSTSYKLFENNFIAFRYSQYNLDDQIKSVLNLKDNQNISVAYSSYMLENKLKLQIEASYNDEKDLNNKRTNYLNLILQFVLMY